MMTLVSSEYDSVTGFTEEIWIDLDCGKMTIRRLQDVEGTLDLNRAEFNQHNRAEYKDSTGGAHKVARIPLVIIEKWLREEGFDWFNSTDKERRAMLNRPEHRYLLVRPGKL